MYKFRTHRKKIIADLITPVSVYQKIRDNFPNSILLESSDYGANDNSYAYICFNPTSTFKVNKNTVEIIYPDNKTETSKINKLNSVVDQLNLYKSKFQLEKSDSKFFENGVIGYMNYDSVQYFENIEFDSKKNKINIPDIFYSFYSNIIIINVFNNEATLLHHSFDEKNNLNTIEDCIRSNKSAKYNFEKSGKISSNLNDQEYIDLVKKGIKHCKRGDVFQTVLSRKFKQSFEGDEFNLYRALRSINPSPYLFYFDYGGYKIFGSSPEAQLVVRNNKAEIHPIAGTFLRTGDDYKDSIEAKKLAVDQKENSEHMMLVDLARNDLSRNGNNVTVEKDREIQFYSHVIHLVSKVTGKLKSHSKDIIGSTFPAGTLSGAPKHMAMKLIEKYEQHNRSFYGGAIGFIDFENNFNHAILIRSFLSKNQNLFFQAGAGIVSKSNPNDELNEVYNKVGALLKALKKAEEI